MFVLPVRAVDVETTLAKRGSSLDSEVVFQRMAALSLSSVEVSLIFTAGHVWC
jgi:hypothetical protein